MSTNETRRIAGYIVGLALTHFGPLIERATEDTFIANVKRFGKDIELLLNGGSPPLFDKNGKRM